MVNFELFMFYHNLKNILDNLAAFLESMSVVKTFFKKKNCIEVQLFYSIVLISAVHQMTQLYTYILFPVFYHGLSQDIEYSCRYYTVLCCAKLLQSYPTVCDSTVPLQPTRLPCPWDSPGKNTRVGCRALLQGLFPTQGSNLTLRSPQLAGGFFTTSTTWEALAKPQ